MIKLLNLKKMARVLTFTFAFLMFVSNSYAQKNKKEKDKKKDDVSSIYNGLTFRSIGPAFMSGRIADIVIHPTNDTSMQ